MPTVPWRIAAQSYTVLDPDTKDPVFTLQFIVDHAQADMMKLRMVPTDTRGAALEMQFSTGGYIVGEPVKQPRWLKPFERVDPNLYLDDERAAEEHHDNLGEQDRASWMGKRDALLKRKEEWESVNGYSGEPQAAGAGQGPDSTDPNSPEAERARSKKSGVDNTSPSDADRKGMTTQPPGGLAGEVNAGGKGEPNAPNSDSQQLQKQGKPVDVKAGQEQSASAS